MPTDSQAPEGESCPTPVRLGAVSFMNAKPLVAGLRSDPRVRLEYAVPSRLAQLLADGGARAALVPVVDLLGSVPLKTVSDACIASDGETLTVRVFSRVPPHRLRRLAADVDSHTSVVLVKLLWHELFGLDLETTPTETDPAASREEGVLLIGDKVVAMRPRGFAFEVDLGAAWRELTRLPFVYAVWAMPAGSEEGGLEQLLSASRDQGMAMVDRIAAAEAPIAGWPVEIARRYLTEYMHYRLTEKHREGMALFLRKIQDLGLVTRRKEEVA